MTIEAMKQALEALEKSVDNFMANTQHQQAITALRQAIAEAEKEKPVMWAMPDGKTVDKWGLQFYGGQTGTPLYTHPPKREWVGLTKNEVEQTLIDHNMGALPHRVECIRAIEAKLKEKNT
jgi:hypothetical protein